MSSAGRGPCAGGKSTLQRQGILLDDDTVHNDGHMAGVWPPWCLRTPSLSPEPIMGQVACYLGCGNLIPGGGGGARYGDTHDRAARGLFTPSSLTG